MTPREAIQHIKEGMSRSIIGQEQVVEQLLIALLSNGNVLMEGLPGLAKTRAIKSLGRCIESEFRRIQFTPDLLPGDVSFLPSVFVADPCPASAKRRSSTASKPAHLASLPTYLRALRRMSRSSSPVNSRWRKAGIPRPRMRERAMPSSAG
jgi:MoxR-like ATPase